MVSASILIPEIPDAINRELPTGGVGGSRDGSVVAHAWLLMGILRGPHADGTGIVVE